MSDYLKGKRVVNLVLVSIARGYKNAAFIGERIFPIVLMDKEGVRIPAFGKIASVEYDTGRAVRMDSNVLIRERTSTLDLVLGEHDLVAPVDYREQTESMLNEEGKAIRRATNGVSLRREFIAAHLTQNEEVYRTGHVKKLIVSDRWAGGKRDPIRVIEAGMEAARMATGLRPNLMTMETGATALLKLRSAIQTAIGANERKRITIGILQDFFQIEEIVIDAPISLPPMKAVMDKNSVSAGIWGDDLMLHYVGKPWLGANSVDENEPFFGYTLRRRGMPAADKYDEAGGKTKHRRYTDIYKVAVAGGDAGHLIIGIGK